ncbi:MAG: DUF1911 domain-containing protein [Treponema sp.]|uniref:PoNe immunity protein domain-containing protein n=1 Tax=Treponema sp. TaxID=166 RepID=UPI0025F1AC33|nr:PoNe immunity protein domain-containing protein [Treponema sp.]MBQ8680607.1 DUF1911 domain-containing protein [Treponema sp.]
MRTTFGNEEKLNARLKTIEYGMNHVPEGLLEFADENPNIIGDYLNSAKEDPINFRSLFLLNYSLGTNLGICFDYFRNWAKFYSKEYDPKEGFGWFELVDVIAISVCYKDKIEDIKPYVLDLFNKTNIKGDFLLNEFYFYLFGKKLVANCNEDNIKYANKIITTKDVNVIKEVLDKEWYNFHKDAYWYNAHNSESNIYEGYWAFDIAAVSKILGIDDSGLKDAPYYPYDLVHFCD